MKLRDVLAAKGSQVYTVQPGQTLQEALGLLTRYRIGALMVVDDDGRAAGILSERDVLRECHARADRLGEILVRDAMSADLIIALPDDALDYVMGVMTRNRIRHLPVMDGGRVVGLVSIGDVVKACLEETQYENRYLREYIQSR